MQCNKIKVSGSEIESQAVSVCGKAVLIAGIIRFPMRWERGLELNSGSGHTFSDTSLSLSICVIWFGGISRSLARSQSFILALGLGGPGLLTRHNLSAFWQTLEAFDRDVYLSRTEMDAFAESGESEFIWMSYTRIMCAMWYCFKHERSSLRLPSV